jgi:hypothetical protein
MRIHAAHGNLTRWMAVAALAFALLGTAVHAETVYGYVTRIDSPTEFDIGTLHVVMDTQTRCIMGRTFLGGEAPKGGVSMGTLFFGRSVRHIPCSTQRITNYCRVRLVGATRLSDGLFFAKKITMYDIRPHSRSLEDGIVLEETPDLSKNGQGWSGKIWMDGYPITVTPESLFVPQPSNTTFHFLVYTTHIAAHAKMQSLKTVQQPMTAVRLRENTCVVFHAVRTYDGNTTATRLQFWPNWIDPKEKKYDKKFVVTVHPPDYSKGTPGTIQYAGAPPITILPNKEILDFVSHLGEGLIPAYQKNLPDSEATKINFHFYVVHTFPAQLGRYFVATSGEISPFGLPGYHMPEYQILYWDRSSHKFYNKPKINATVHNVVAAPDGTVLIPDVILGELQNTAQLAVLLSTAITSVVQNQDYHAWPNYISYVQDSFAFTPSPLIGSWQSEQALRIGIRQMYLAGYDIREAPYAWAVARVSR